MSKSTITPANIQIIPFSNIVQGPVDYSGTQFGSEVELLLYTDQSPTFPGNNVIMPLSQLLYKEVTLVNLSSFSPLIIFGSVADPIQPIRLTPGSEIKIFYYGETFAPPVGIPEANFPSYKAYYKNLSPFASMFGSVLVYITIDPITFRGIFSPSTLVTGLDNDITQTASAGILPLVFTPADGGLIQSLDEFTTASNVEFINTINPDQMHFIVETRDAASHVHEVVFFWLAIIKND